MNSCKEETLVTIFQWWMHISLRNLEKNMDYSWIKFYDYHFSLLKVFTSCSLFTTRSFLMGMRWKEEKWEWWWWKQRKFILTTMFDGNYNVFMVRNQDYILYLALNISKVMLEWNSTFYSFVFTTQMLSKKKIIGEEIVNVSREGERDKIKKLNLKCSHREKKKWRGFSWDISHLLNST